jgi:hypothetical protein
MTPQVPTGFEAAQAVWVRLGGVAFRKTYAVGPRSAFYQSEYWKTVKHEFLVSRDFKCCRCTGKATQVHHLNYDHLGEDHLHPDSLVAICRPCHGLVEYARNAGSLMSRIRRRISLGNGFIEGGYPDQNPTHLFARLLEYKEVLSDLKSRFSSRVFYEGSQLITSEKRKAFEDRAEITVASWGGSEREIAQKVLLMLELELVNCKTFISEVFAPVDPGINPIASLKKKQSQTIQESGICESLVVGIKYHRGHVDGISRGDTVCLVREPDNSFDANAVAVSLSSGEKLGYLTKEIASVIAKKIDAGILVYAQVSHIVCDKVFVVVSISVGF